MGWGERIHHAAGKLHGKATEAAGAATGNDRLKAEGKSRQLKADMKLAGERIKGAFRKH
ncbi:CsbD family protein [Arthrobacter bambusae]|uniref:CsbD family protein n=1 Tax=Arthrobacter bambusae TaxID=1338426 RepID=UPI002783AAA0|nr:CsbD family protein [Arthrobacter bambusae]MDQ0028443.1 uncharacterized protein YjbJ (UPF0337 family) [Arthrobacter bambusae]MDQ0096762.1 uncharacterized protein YjbJ (UPF0337 family) [Arthrobacter bambusae]